MSKSFLFFLKMGQIWQERDSAVGVLRQIRPRRQVEHKSQQSRRSQRWRVFPELRDGMQLLAVCCTPVISDSKPLTTLTVVTFSST